MPVHVLDDGKYELFTTPNDNWILSLNGKRWFAWVSGRKGEILVLSDEDHERAKTEMRGRFVFAEFENDPTFRDVPHLFLQDGDRYHEVMVPNGLPEARNYQKKVIWSDNTISKKELESYLKQPAPAGPGSARTGRPRGGSMSNVAHYLKGIGLPANKKGLIEYAQRQGAPSQVVDKLREIKGGQYRTMADVMKAATGTESRPDDVLPIEHYDDLSAAEIGKTLDKGELTEDEVRVLHDYEQQHAARKTLMRKFDAILSEGTTEGAKVRRRPGGASMSNVVRYLDGVDLPADKAGLIEYAQSQDAPAEVLDKLRDLADGTYATIADVTRAAKRQRTDTGLPIENYDDRRVDEVQRMLAKSSFTPDDIETLHAYEEQHQSRRTLLDTYEQELQRSRTAEPLPIQNYNDLTINELRTKLDDLDAKQLEQLRTFEQQHKNRRTLIEAFDRKLHKTRA